MSTFLVSKRTIMQELPPETQEMLIAIATGWSLEYIRNMNSKDFEIASDACQVYFRAQKGWSESHM